MAAVLASGEGAALSHRSAAELWGMLKPRGGVIHVSIPTSAGRRPHRGIRLHRSPYLPKSATTHHNGIAVTTPARTIADLRRVATVDELGRAIREAEYLKLPIGDPLGARDELTRSKLERRFLALCRRHRLPKPEVNVKIEGYEVDFLWRAERLVVEVDGYRSHGTRSAFESDRDRDARLKLLGYEVLRFTDRSVTGDPAGVAAMVRALLAARSG